MKLFLLCASLLPLTAACTAEVSHPTKNLADQQADIDLCTKSANHKYWMDPVAALYNAYDCLEAKGYRRSRKDFAAKVERALGEKPATPRRAEPGKPCRIPCT
ncbi:MAG TPA: hypothetical protein VF727_07415 [Allosphingosinicella sp.]|jgi:hypothetical protein